MSDIMDTAFVKYLKSLSPEQRVEHLGECFVSGGGLFFELAEHLNEFNPVKLARLVDEYDKNG